MSNNYEERKMIQALHEKELFDEIMPAIRAAIKAGGGADTILKKSESLAAVNLIKHSTSDDAGVALKASIEILNRTQGKPIERSVNIYGDISRMDERDVDNQIMQLLEKTGARQLIDRTLDLPKPKKKRLQKRKPRKSDPLVIEADYTETTARVDASPETGTSSVPQEEGTP